MVSYRKFEALVLSLGFCVILASIFITYNQQSNLTDIIGQALMGPVLFLALHYGRRAGFVAALVAAFAYLVRHVHQGATLSLPDPATQMLVLRAAMFGLIGIVAGELPGRFKYLSAKINDSSVVDQMTNLFSRLHMHDILKKSMTEYHRYGHPFSTLLLDIQPRVEPIKRQTKLISEVALVLRNNARLVDDVGRWDQLGFCLLLRETPPRSAVIVAARLKKRIRSHLRNVGLDVDDLLISDTVISFPEQEQELLSLLGMASLAEVPMESLN